MLRISDERSDRPETLLRRAKAFDRAGRAHHAEIAVNQALRAGARPGVVAEALEGDLQLPSMISRRQALKLTAALLGTGVLASSPLLHASTAAATGLLTTSATGAGGLAATFLRRPLTDGTGQHQLLALTSSGIGAVGQSLSGSTIALDAFSAVNVNHSCRGGWPQTTITQISTLGVSTQYALPVYAAISGPNYDPVRTTLAIAGGYLFCHHLRGQIFGDTSITSKDPTKRIYVQSDNLIEIVDLANNQLVGIWQGPTLAGACRTGFKVCADGSAMVLAVHAPEESSGTFIYYLAFDGNSVDTATTRAGADQTFVFSLLQQSYSWPQSSGSLIQVANHATYAYGAESDVIASSPLTPEYGNNRLPPVFEADFAQDGSGLISSGDGRVSPLAASGIPGAEVSLPGATSDPPFLVYGAKFLSRPVTYSKNGVWWVIDNREGIGGVWQIDAATVSPVAHVLTGNYCSGCAINSTGAQLVVLNRLESVLYLIDTTSASAIAAIDIKPDDILI